MPPGERRERERVIQELVEAAEVVEVQQANPAADGVFFAQFTDDEEIADLFFGGAVGVQRPGQGGVGEVPQPGGRLRVVGEGDADEIDGGRRLAVGAPVLRQHVAAEVRDGGAEGRDQPGVVDVRFDDDPAAPPVVDGRQRLGEGRHQLE